MFKLLFVCTGNICRSPTAHGVFRHLVARAGLADRLSCESRGTHGYHVGEPPDARAISAAAARGHELSDLRARRLSPADFTQFDLLLAMDHGHLGHMRAMAPPGGGRVALFLEEAGMGKGDVPDPWYDGPAEFEAVLDLCEAGCQALLKKLAP